MEKSKEWLDVLQKAGKQEGTWEKNQDFREEEWREKRGVIVMVMASVMVMVMRKKKVMIMRKGVSMKVQVKVRAKKVVCLIHPLVTHQPILLTDIKYTCYLL